MAFFHWLDKVPTCSHCGRREETAKHLLLLCPKWEAERQCHVFEDQSNLMEFLVSSGHVSPYRHCLTQWQQQQLECVALPSVMAALCCHLANATKLCLYRNVSSMQHRFLIDNILLCSRRNRNESQSCFFVRNRAKISCFGPPKFPAEGAPNFWPNFINLGHHWTCAKVWWRMAKGPRR